MRSPGGPPKDSPVKSPDPQFAAYAAMALIIAAASSLLSEPIQATSLPDRNAVPKIERQLPANHQIESAEDNSSPRPETMHGRSKAEVRCLARAIYHEARGEPLTGQIAVAEVVIARSKDRRWRGDLCHTIRMPKQFSFVRNGRLPGIDDPEDAQVMMDLARAVISGRVESPAKGSLYYHATYVAPSWRHALEKTAKIENHVFYSDPTTT